jgi:16S rRNA (guanine966-N2)-methyltransferase
LRVIAGTARGTKLKTSQGLSVRPTADQVKEALFNIVSSRISDSLFLDLYAGSGAVGIEALSRGACCCIFIDHKRENIELIRQNLIKTRLGEKARLICADAGRTIDNLVAEKIEADLVFIDPPYNVANLELIVKQIIGSQLVSASGLIVVEHVYKNNSWAEPFNQRRIKKYGNTGLTFITPPAG